MLTAKFQEFLERSAQLRPGYPASLGKAPAEGSAVLAAWIPEVPGLLQAVYDTVLGTGGGEEDPTLVEFIPGYRLIHIGEYAGELEMLSGILEEKGYTGGGVVLPLLTNYGSDYICYYKSEDGTERICDLLHDYGDLVVMYDSPATFLETLCEFYKQEVYFLDEEGYLDCDLVMEGEVGAALNPGAAYWSE